MIFDLDKKRLRLLEKLTQKAGCKSILFVSRFFFKKIMNLLSLIDIKLERITLDIEAIHKSFLDVNPLDERYSKVEYILVDPSCSGSGIVNRLDGLVDSSGEYCFYRFVMSSSSILNVFLS